MSEFSQSLHLLSRSADEAVELLRRARVPGVVAGSVDGWVALYPPLFADPYTGRRADLERILAQAGPGILVLWIYAEDHGMTVEVHQDGRFVALLETSWETRQTQAWDREAFLALGLLTEAQATEIDAWLARHEPGYLVAERLGLRGYAWVDADRAWASFDAGKLPSTFRLVRRDGSVNTTG